MNGNYQKVKSIILRLGLEESLNEKIIVVGGTAPYLISIKKNRIEKHSDIDIIVEKDEMILYENIWKENNCKQ